MLAAIQGVAFTSRAGSRARNTEKTIVTMKDQHHVRSEDYMGRTRKEVIVLNADKAWHRREGKTSPIPKEEIAAMKKANYDPLFPPVLLELKRKEFRLEMVGEEAVRRKPALVVQVKGPDGNVFRVFFDKESGLPVKSLFKDRDSKDKLVWTEELFLNYREFNGIKVPTRVETMRDGWPVGSAEITEYRLLDKVDPATFDMPK
jgi:hypothetical protein